MVQTVDSREPSCFECKNAVIMEDRSVGIQPHLDDCKGGIPEELFENYENLTEEEMAKRCGHFDPVMVEKCGNCNKDINAPRHLHTLWAYGYDEVPYCSEKCREELQAKTDEEVRI